MINTKKLVPFKIRATKLTTMASNISITDKISTENATMLRSYIKTLSKQIKEKKEEITKPINLALKNVRILFEPLETSCIESAKIIDTKLIAYARQIEEIRQAEEQKLITRVEKGTLKTETAAKKMQNLPEPIHNVTTDNGGISIAKIKKFKIIDLARIPLEYHLPNEVAIRKAMYEGLQLEGVEYWEEENVRGT